MLAGASSSGHDRYRHRRRARIGMVRGESEPGCLSSTVQAVRRELRRMERSMVELGVGRGSRQQPGLVVHAANAAECAVGQSGPVWFLGGPVSGEEEPEERNCTVPAGKAILVPIINAEWSSGEGDCPLPDTPGGSTEAALRACAKAFMDLVDTSSMTAVVDFVGLNNAAFYRFQSPMFELTTVDGNWAVIPAGEHDLCRRRLLLHAPAASAKESTRSITRPPFHRSDSPSLRSIPSPSARRRPRAPAGETAPSRHRALN